MNKIAFVIANENDLQKRLTLMKILPSFEDPFCEEAISEAAKALNSNTEQVLAILDEELRKDILGIQDVQIALLVTHLYEGYKLDNKRVKPKKWQIDKIAARLHKLFDLVDEDKKIESDIELLLTIARPRLQEAYKNAKSYCAISDEYIPVAIRVFKYLYENSDLAWYAVKAFGSSLCRPSFWKYTDLVHSFCDYLELRRKEVANASP